MANCALWLRCIFPKQNTFCLKDSCELFEWALRLITRWFVLFFENNLEMSHEILGPILTSSSALFSLSLKLGHNLLYG